MFKRINIYLLRRFIQDYEKVDNSSIRTKYGYLEGWISVVINFSLFLVKLVCGLWINSISLLADAFHTLSDVLTSIAIIVGFKIADKPGDREHPFGHGRVEHITTLIVCILLFGVGLGFLKESYNKLINPGITEYNVVVLVLMIVCAIAKEWLYDFSKFLGIKINSQALIADAWHHRSDAIASLLIGIALYGTKLGFNNIDAILGIIVSFMIIYTGYDLIKDCLSEIIGKAPSEDFLKVIEDSALSVDGVKDVHNIQVHQYGTNKYVNLHIKIDSDLTVLESHDIADSVEKKLNNKHGILSVIHVDPYTGF